MNNGATSAQLQVSGTPVGTAGVIPILTTETTLFGAAALPKTVTLTFVNIGAASIDLTVYFKPTAATPAADANTPVKAFPIAVDGMLTVTYRVPSYYVLTALASAAGINATGYGTQEI